MVVRPSHVLVVEDDPEIRGSLIDVLECEGFQVLAVANGREALALLRGPAGASVSVVLLDLMMPVMGGQEFRARQLADRDLAALPVVVMTAADHADLDALRPDGVLRKPFHTERLVDTLLPFATPAASPLRGVG